MWEESFRVIARVYTRECMDREVIPAIDSSIGTLFGDLQDYLHHGGECWHTQARRSHTNPHCVVPGMCANIHYCVHASLWISHGCRIGHQSDHFLSLHFLRDPGGNPVKKWKDPGSPDHHCDHPDRALPRQARSAPLRTTSDRVRHQRRSSAHAVSGRPHRDLRQPWHR